MHRLKEFMEKLEECAKCEFDKGIQNVDTKEMGEVIDMIKDCTEAMYYYSIVEAMKESEYGEDYDWEGRKHYRGQRRDSKGRFMSGRRGGMRRGYEPDYRMPPEMDEDMEEYWRDMDIAQGRMYYNGDGSNRSGQGSGVRNTGDTSNRGRSGSRYGYSHDEYMKKREMYSKDDPEHKKKRTEMLNEYMDDLSDMAKEMVADMSPEEKQMWKVKLNKLINM